MENMNRHQSKERRHRKFIRKHGKSLLADTLRLISLDLPVANIALELGIDVAEVTLLVEKEHQIVPIFRRTKTL